MKIKAKVKIDSELAKIIDSSDPDSIKIYLEDEIKKEFKKEIDELSKKLEEELLYREKSEKEPIGLFSSEGGYTFSNEPTILLDFNSMHPSMWVNYKPKLNHYQRMMNKRKNGKTIRSLKSRRRGKNK